MQLRRRARSWCSARAARSVALLEAEDKGTAHVVPVVRIRHLLPEERSRRRFRGARPRERSAVRQRFCRLDESRRLDRRPRSSSAPWSCVTAQALPLVATARSVCPRLAAPRTGSLGQGGCAKPLRPRRLLGGLVLSRPVPGPSCAYGTRGRHSARAGETPASGASRPLLSERATPLGVTARSPTLTRC